MPESPIGSLISLISKAEIRYEGILNFINPDENTVGLRDVYLKGTEGRLNGVNEIAPNPNPYDYIVFRGADIKDLKVFTNTNNNNNQGVGPGIPPDPAVKQAGPQSNVGGGDRYSQYNNNNNSNNNNNYRGGYNTRYDDFRRGSGGNNNSNNNNMGREGHHGSRYHTGQDFVVATGNRREVLEEFDFAKAAENFEKHRAEFEKAREEVRAENIRPYNKGSFFDNLSCDNNNNNNHYSGGGRNYRGDGYSYNNRRRYNNNSNNNFNSKREEARRTDAETFGAEMVGQMRQFRRNGNNNNNNNNNINNNNNSARNSRGRYGNRY